MCTASLALFGNSSFEEDELTPEPTGKEGRLDWAFFVGVVGALGSSLTSLLFYTDSIRLALKNGGCR